MPNSTYVVSAWTPALYGLIKYNISKPVTGKLLNWNLSVTDFYPPLKYSLAPAGYYKIRWAQSSVDMPPGVNFSVRYHLPSRLIEITGAYGNLTMTGTNMQISALGLGSVYPRYASLLVQVTNNSQHSVVFQQTYSGSIPLLENFTMPLNSSNLYNTNFWIVTGRGEIFYSMEYGRLIVHN